MSKAEYQYLNPQLDQGCTLVEPALAGMTERHPVVIRRAALEPVSPAAVLAAPGCAGLIIELVNGWPWPAHLKLARKALLAGKRVFFYWPREQVVEVADAERLRSYWRLCWMVWLVNQGVRILNTLGVARWVRAATGLSAPAAEAAAAPVVAPSTPVERLQILDKLASSTPTSLQPALAQDSGAWRVAGRGVYLRTDYWSRITSGGSYGHTCHVAHELARASDGLVCFMANRFSMLDEMGLHQVIVGPPFAESSEQSLLAANEHFYVQLKTALEALQPAYLYERAVLGNYVGARLAAELGIPYLLEYNGSEISIQKSFGTTRFENEEEFLRIESVAFKQATVISVISEPVKSDLVARGIAADKILVNPNGVDLDSYCPASPDERTALRAELGFGPDDRVIGFTGTFGGWHGIDTLASALPMIIKRCKNARVLLIGDGHKKALVDQAIHDNGLWDVVHCAGRVPQQEGARLLKTCDICMTPHNAHMVDGKFFGSPTKLFEYMGMGVGIVASDLEQMGEVLNPSVRAEDLPAINTLDTQRAILCAPGDLRQFVEAVVYLCEHPEVSDVLGRNARQAAESCYAWRHHVQRLLGFAAGHVPASVLVPQAPVQAAPALVTGDRYKDEVQNQWDHDPCGSHYVKDVPKHTLEWFLEVERYRYEQYGPWMPRLMEFDQHAGEEVLEIGAGMGTDHAQFARHGARMTDVDLSAGHLALARENFLLRGLQGTFVHHDAENLPFQDNHFDLVYSNGVIHHTPNTQQVVDEIYRVLKPGGKAIIMVYAENSLHYWRNLVLEIGLGQAQIYEKSIGAIMSEAVEISENDAKPLVKVYTPARLRQMFSAFTDIEITQCQLTPAEVPPILKRVPLETLGRWMGWNLVIKACKPRA
jgi:glycosyltransferase involved in cell wall biosynthesis/ubiquinone/menaquinone biosynthesis C-methylase UbiE